MTSENFLQLLNAVVKVVKPYHDETPEFSKMDMEFVDMGLDSLDTLMLVVYTTDIFGVDEELTKNVKVTNPQQLFDFLLENKTKEVTNVDQVIAELK